MLLRRTLWLLACAFFLGATGTVAADSWATNPARLADFILIATATPEVDQFWFDERGGVIVTTDGIVFVLPAGSDVPIVAQADESLRRRRPVRRPSLQADTLVHVGDFATFSSTHYGVSGTATIVSDGTIQLRNFSSDGSAPGLDIRIGLASQSRRDFTVLEVIGRTQYQGATIDLTLPEGVTLDDFDTFTIWCFEFDVLIAEGRFERP